MASVRWTYLHGVRRTLSMTLLGFPLECHPKVMVRSHECSLCVSYVIYISYKNSLSLIVRKNMIRKPKTLVAGAYQHTLHRPGTMVEQRTSHTKICPHPVTASYLAICARPFGRVMLRTQRCELGTSARVSSRWEVA